MLSKLAFYGNVKRKFNACDLDWKNDKNLTNLSTFLDSFMDIMKEIHCHGNQRPTCQIPNKFF